MTTDNKYRELWNKLTPEQQEELLLSDEESSDEKNLVGHEDAIKMFARWLNEEK